MTLQRFAMVLLMLGATTALAADRNAVFGKWASKDSIIDVGEKDGALHATIISILDPLYLKDEDGPMGTPRVDLHNPDAAQRSRPLIGMNLVDGYQFKNGKWQGNLYDPESGKTYKSQLTVDKGRLQMRGYVGTPMFGRTEVWEPVSACSGNIPKLLANAKLPPCG